MLSPVEEMGLKLAVMYRTGELRDFSCAKCSEPLQKMRNCDGTDDKPVMYIPSIGQLKVCPIRLIPDTIIRFLDEYDYYTKFPNAYHTPYDDANPKFWEAVKTYDRLYAEWEQNEHEKMMAKSKSK